MDVFQTAEDIINERGSELFTISPDALVTDAIALMTEKKVGCILVAEEGDLVGIWTERDLLNNALKDGFELKTAKIRDYMKTKLIYARHDDIIYHLIDKFLGLRVRHLLIKRDEKCIGMLSAGDVMRAALQQRTEELERMRDLVKLDYYDEWRWKSKRKK
ncbi:MAG: CBS domain-containing protein [Phycisphaerae bacterium]|nr:CBS domain-containing protein [Phycisphaerae bacterium]